MMRINLSSMDTTTYPETTHDPDAPAAVTTRPGRDAAALCSLTEGVWGALQIVSPQGIESTTLEEIAAAVGIDLDVLLGENQDLVPDLLPSPDGHHADEYALPESGKPTEENDTVAADLSNLALLSTAPHTHEDSATPLRETFRSAMHNLAVNKTRGLLTMLGIIIGVCAVAFMLALGNGLLGYVNDITGQYGANNVTIQPARLIVNGVDTGTLAHSLSLADAQALAQPSNVPDAIAVSPTLLTRAIARAGSGNIATTVVGVWPDYLTAGGFNLTTGSFVTADDVVQQMPVAVLGANVATTLFGDADPLGQTIWVNGVAFRVVGEMAALETLIAGGDDSVFVPLSALLGRLYSGQPSTSDGSRAIDSVVIRARTSTVIEAVQNESIGLLTTRHQLDGAPSDFKITSLLTALQQRAQILAAINAIMAVIAGISLLVGGIGIMNIMLVSVAERTREIGLRKAVGARGRDILTQFLVESTFISLIGAGIGIGLAGLLVLLISILWRPCPPSVVGTTIAVLAALATGLFFGVSPARRAAALQPIEALRAE